MNAKDVEPLVVFSLDGQQYALRISAVERVVRAVAISPLPKAPAFVAGIVNIQGTIVPVFDLRRKGDAPSQEPRSTDHLLIARAGRRTVAMVVDAVLGVLHPEPEAVTASGELLSGLDSIDGVVRGDDGIVIIFDLESFLTPAQDEVLDAAVPESTHGV